MKDGGAVVKMGPVAGRHMRKRAEPAARRAAATTEWRPKFSVSSLRNPWFRRLSAIDDAENIAEGDGFDRAEREAFALRRREDVRQGVPSP